ncbi:MAG: hypothetical protein CM15mP47_5300 [Methanobacteriota archaeon]|nr:MAG: hypothetical protein CM15mP47_5300 [Euryarchaeota archaeon]
MNHKSRVVTFILSAVLDSPFGLDALAYSDSIEMFVDGLKVDGDPIETQRGDSIVVTWTWLGAEDWNKSHRCFD